MSLQETLASIAKSGLPLQGKLDALKAEFETNLAPAPVVEAMHRATDELIASGAQDKALKAGDAAPEFTLPDADGKDVSSKALLAKGPLVVTFYRAPGARTATSIWPPLRKPAPRSRRAAQASSRSRSKRRPTAASRSGRTG